MTSGYSVNGTDLDNWFDPYISGTQPAATGYKVSGVDLNQRYAPLYLGVQAALTGYAVNGADLNTLFAKIGTAQYLLPINGVEYQASAQPPIKEGGSCEVSFGFSSTTQYFIQTSVTFGTGNPIVSTYSFAVPAGMTQVLLTLTDVSGSASSTGNNATTLTDIATTLSAFIKVNGSLTVTEQAKYTLQVQFADAAGAIIWSGTATFYVEFVPF